MVRSVPAFVTSPRRGPPQSDRRGPALNDGFSIIFPPLLSDRTKAFPKHPSDIAIYLNKFIMAPQEMHHAESVGPAIHRVAYDPSDIRRANIQVERIGQVSNIVSDRLVEVRERGPIL